MKRFSFLLALLFMISFAYSQNQDQTFSGNSSQKMLDNPNRLTIGGYGQIDFNQPIENGNISNGVLDVHRLVILFGYKFDDRTSFITEIEMEHVKEVFVEQAFVNYKVKPWLNIRGGLMLIPMGIVNEYHEPPTYNGVERPNVDKYIVPSTWREIGIGLNGQFLQSGIDYQVYLVNGFLGSKGENPGFSGSSMLRSGRQKGAESVISSPNLAFRINYSGVPGLSTGFSGYFGKSQSTLFDGVDRSDPLVMARADSSIVGINMMGIDGRYTKAGIGIRAQFITGSISNAEQYNVFHNSELGSGFYGYYAELSYDIFHTLKNTDDQLIPFLRYENYDTHQSVDESIEQNPAYDRTDITFGFGWKPNSGLIYKIDYQVFNFVGQSNSKKQLNVGIGVWF